MNVSKTVIIVLSSLTISYMVFSRYVFVQDDLRGMAALKMVRIGGGIIDSYYKKSNLLPPSEGSRLPCSLLSDNDVIKEAYVGLLGRDAAVYNEGKLPVDPFSNPTDITLLVDGLNGREIYVSGEPVRYFVIGENYVVYSCGPDKIYDIVYPNIPTTYTDGVAYDATNGTMSSGDIYFIGNN